MTHLFWLILVTCYGACVGSFLNVVIYRLPAGQSLVTPGSQCPKCGHKLAWFDNVPVFAWLWLRGKCRYCKTPISIQYPIIEAVCAALFVGLYCVYYFTELRPEFFYNGLETTWPALLLHLIFIAALLAATMIDARLFIIPLSIPWLVTVLAVIWLPLSIGTDLLVQEDGIAPQLFTAGELGMVLGAVAGLAVAIGLLQTRMLPRSFDDVEEQVTDPAPHTEPGPDEWLAHPHPRREVLKECLFLALPALGLAIGWATFPEIAMPGWLQVLAGVLAGYLVGGALVWVTRIAGTLGFGKEAMGLGDVHLLAAIGAVLGPWEAVFTFFIAPFFGLLAALVMAGVAKLVKGEVRVIPYGPYLAGAAIVVMVLREPLFDFFGIV
ncbi:A24 family peptidase [Phycisphaerales bacterium AB-hyl4]|uniref:A24 family peptidase n=1 Tax=Natronomicrosphaera hydrolytica TaxID=3242702 RepID=A0ABV4U0R6_9BACT